MDILGRAGIFILLTLVGIIIIIFAAIIAVLRNRKKLNAFKDYVRQNFSYLPEDISFLAAKTTKGNIAIIIDEIKNELLFLFSKGKNIDHKIYLFNDLSDVESKGQVISRGISPDKIYSYQKTMELKFRDGSSYNFILENISNQNGDDKGKEALDGILAPWEIKLKGILNDLQLNA
jgi:hypothetical protein